jgi:hypothetical protein
MWRSLFSCAVLAGSVLALAQDRDLVHVSRSSVRFTSTAPLERITAANDRVKGVLDRVDRSFAVQVPIVDFVGFNAPLQREHFNENYMVSTAWPYATFTGRIIEGVDLRSVGKHELRAKGTLTIRGEGVERVIPCKVEAGDEGIRVRSSFEVPLADHGIRIPRVVQQKIAALVQVELDLFFAAKP